MIKNINEEMIVDKTVYVPRIVKINNFFNANPYGIMLRNLCVLYKRKYSGASMLYSACYGVRKRR